MSGRKGANDHERQIVTGCGWSWPRSLVALISGALLVLAFYYLHGGLIDGRAFVNLLMLAFAIGLIALVWDRVTQITVFGSEIKMRRLTREAQYLLGELDSSKKHLYKTTLHLMQQSANQDGADDSLDKRRSQALIELLDEIEGSGLIQKLSDDALSTLDCTMATLVNRLQQRGGHVDAGDGESSPQRAEQTIRRFDDAHRHHTIMAGQSSPATESDATTRQILDDLKTLLRHREWIERTCDASRDEK